MQINGMEAIRLTIEIESKRRKCSMFVWAVVHFFIVGVLALTYLLWMMNVKKMQDSYEDLLESEDKEVKYVLYDVIWRNGPFTDSE